ncbi:Cof-type HAD-IIB family hydrolase [Nonomuraea angiospora]|uniref:Cof subfamily protein (Haloacid dehalogenase superfamily) n=1 Tax=Nonomuraea angiospora TaxID=46172 RepID=A0ABR9LWV8_9ACTN|nr:HAD family hydrolase [Nonomuraea angiospora]MBE1585124.1 Cof subfamily protein (haloacid dehalogenase superfamily) [Nonomuraea angiospora]
MSAGTLPRLVATDLDGTLLNSSRAITPRTRQALQAARAAGAEIVFVTARPPRAVRALAAEAGVTGVAICSNGAIVYDLAADEIVTSRLLDRTAANTVAQALAAALPGIGLAIETGRGVLAEVAYTRRLVEDLAYLREVSSVFDGDDPIVKLLAQSHTSTADEMVAAVVARVEGLAEVTHSGGTGLLEISAPGVTKASTLDVLCREWGIAPGEVVAFGDMPNDLAVLSYAGAGYAMANAHHLVLAATERRTLSNDEDGVAAVLEKLYG